VFLRAAAESSAALALCHIAHHAMLHSAHAIAKREWQMLKCEIWCNVSLQVDNTINKTLPIKVNVPSADSIGRDLKSKDWRFWALILAGIGFAAALSGALSR
jgi:hypothetical protein